MSNRVKILIIDDEDSIRKLLEITLNNNGYDVYKAEDGKSGLIIASNHPPDLIILDIGLPDITGHKVLERLRDWYTNPIIILSVLNDEESVISALDLGANDYLTKPFRTGELLARIRSVLKSKNTGQESSVIVKFGDFELDFSSRTLKKSNTPIKLTATEFSLLTLLVKNSGIVLSHHFLLKSVWGPGFIEESQYLRVFIAQLRKKIETDANHPKFIVTESRIGYRFLIE
jgi:two-component system KDP operon response regulator KdpE